jgi:hypothetical protein
MENQRRTKARRDGLYLVLLGCAAFLALGFLVLTVGRAPLMDFRTAYYSGQCLLHSCDPYRQDDIERLLSEEIPPPTVPDPNRIVVTRNIYLPSAIPWTLPFALLPRVLALACWVSIIAGSFVLASLLVWKIAATDAPFLSAVLLSFCLVNSISLLNSGNPAGFVVPFCILAALSFVCGKFVPMGIACFAISLAFKPHDGGLIWLYFLLAGGILRKHALETLAVVAAFSLPALFWIMHISPYWLRELSANLAAFSGNGDINDPRGVHGALMMTNLQTVTSFFWDDPHFYNLVSYLICAPLIVLWIFLTLRARRSTANMWFALASISALSVLPIYHRQYDAKMILLALPALALLWARRGPVAWTSLAVTATAFFFNGDFPWIVFLHFIQKLHHDSGPYQSAAKALSDFPVPVSLLFMGVFYLWVYARSVLGDQKFAEAGSVQGPDLQPVGDLN